jgi:SNF2 family DNA or RNA helicase
MSPGMGKTTVAYAIYQILRGRGFAKRVLVIAPLRVCWNVWPTQVKEWKEFASLKVNVLHGKFKDRDLADLSANLYVVNPEGLPWLTGMTMVGNRVTLDPERMKYLRENFDILVVDESTKFKDTQTKRFKILRQFIKSFRRRYILTGTFSPNGLLDLFGQVYILDEGDSLGAYITHYKNKYFYVDHTGYVFTPHSWSAGEIARKIAPLCLVLDRKEHLDMPDLLFNDIKVDLPPQARVHYQLMENALVALLAEGNVIAGNEAVATSKCRQICQGGLYTGDTRGWVQIHDEKVEALEELIEEMSGEPLLVAYEFIFDLEKIQKKLNVPAIGQGSQKKDSELIQAFNAGTLPVLLGHPASISLGLNLQGSCSNVCFYGLTWKLQDYLQTIDRVYRQGQKNNVIIHRIIAKDTLDERVLTVLNSKEKKQDDFLKLLGNLRNDTLQQTHASGN